MLIKSTDEDGRGWRGLEVPECGEGRDGEDLRERDEERKGMKRIAGMGVRRACGNYSHLV